MEYVILESYPNYMEAHIMLGRLEEEGINCWLKDENTTTVIPIWNTALGGIKLMVYAAQYERAAGLLLEIKQSRAATNPCPACGGTDVQFINTVRKPINWLSAALTSLMGDMALMPEQRYHCFTCGKEWKMELGKDD